MEMKSPKRRSSCNRLALSAKLMMTVVAKCRGSSTASPGETQSYRDEKRLGWTQNHPRANQECHTRMALPSPGSSRTAVPSCACRVCWREGERNQPEMPGGDDNSDLPVSFLTEEAPSVTIRCDEEVLGFTQYQFGLCLRSPMI